MPYIQLVTYRCTDAPLMGALKKLRTWSKFQDISGQLLKFQENAEAQHYALQPTDNSVYT